MPDPTPDFGTPPGVGGAFGHFYEDGAGLDEDDPVEQWDDEEVNWRGDVGDWDQAEPEQLREHYPPSALQPQPLYLGRHQTLAHTKQPGAVHMRATSVLTVPEGHQRSGNIDPTASEKTRIDSEFSGAFGMNALPQVCLYFSIYFL